jgi:hypothetical protein
MTPIRSSPVSLPGTYLSIYLPRIAFVPLFLTHSNPHSLISIISVINTICGPIRVDSILSTKTNTRPFIERLKS